MSGGNKLRSLWCYSGSATCLDRAAEATYSPRVGETVLVLPAAGN